MEVPILKQGLYLIASIQAALSDEHTLHSDMVIRIGDGQDGYKGIASPIKLSRTPASYRLAPPQRKK